MIGFCSNACLDFWNEPACDLVLSVCNVFLFSIIHRRLLTWEKPEWRPIGRRRYTASDADRIVPSHSNN